MESNTIAIALMTLAYGAFLGYCLGRAQGYYKGAEMAESIYRK
jgi:ABC-type dipeptide/oligopeptide/nickel transport system permease subunit